MKWMNNNEIDEQFSESTTVVYCQSLCEVQDHSDGVSLVSSFSILPVPYYLLLRLRLLCPATLPHLDLVGKASMVRHSKPLIQ